MPVFGIHGEAVCPVLCVPAGDCILSRGDPFGAKQALLEFVLPRVSFRGFRGLEGRMASARWRSPARDDAQVFRAQLLPVRERAPPAAARNAPDVPSRPMRVADSRTPGYRM